MMHCFLESRNELLSSFSKDSQREGGKIIAEVSQTAGDVDLDQFSSYLRSGDLARQPVASNRKSPGVVCCALLLFPFVFAFCSLEVTF